MPLPVEFPDPFDDADPIDAAMLNAVANFVYGVGGNPQSIYIGNCYPDEAVAITGNSMAIFYFASVSETAGRQNTSAINNEWKHGAFLTGDTYTLKLRAIKNNSSGIIKIKIDDVVVATFDLYNSSETVADLTQGSIVLTSGWHSIKGLVDNKNGSSSGYDANWAKLTLTGANV